MDYSKAKREYLSGLRDYQAKKLAEEYKARHAPKPPAKPEPEAVAAEPEQPETPDLASLDDATIAKLLGE